MAKRWSDNDNYFGPFTFFWSDRDCRKLGVMLDSGYDEYPGCHVRFYCYWFVLFCALPAIIQPYREKIVPNWDAATIERIGRDWYFDEYAQEYGFYVTNDGFFNLHYGPQTHESSTTKSKGHFLPWTQWRYIGRRWYGLNGELTGDSYQKKGRSCFGDERSIEAATPKAVFRFSDYDGEEITATTHIEEREWHFGEGWFKWLSLFRKPLIRRSLDIRFSAETGRKKGSWKGGTVGHSIDMLVGELHEAAFRRYCTENEMEFIGHA